MDKFLAGLASVLVLGVLAAIFASLAHRRPGTRQCLWLAGWVLMFVHQVAALGSASGLPGRTILDSIHLCAIHAAAIAFVISMAQVAESRADRNLVAALIGIPMMVYSVLYASHVNAPVAYALLLAIAYYGTTAWLVTRVKIFPRFISSIAVVALIYGGFWIWHTWSVGDKIAFRNGYLSVPALEFAIMPLLLWRRYRRTTPGVICAVVGSAAWACIYAVPFIFPALYNQLGPQHQLWEAPKYAVAFGMILILLEDETLAAQRAGEREHLLNLQIQRFAEITSRLLGASDVASLCGHIAAVISECTTFERVGILLTNDQHRLYLAGSAGLDAEVTRKLEASLTRLSPEFLGGMCALGRKLGANSYICAAKDAAQFGAVTTTRDYPPNPYWQGGNELVVPLHCDRGGFVGLISLDDPKDVTRITADEMVKVEMLATDLAVAVEKISLQKQLVQSEKLAGIGQLVAGLAHELNNPLTAVLGYAEMLSMKPVEEPIRRELGIVQRESLRMKRIIQDLLRFAQPDKAARGAVSVQNAIEDALRLRNYQVKHSNVSIEVRCAPDLPRVSFDEGQLKQLFMNLLGNALDAIEGSDEKRVVISAVRQDSSVCVEVSDSGPGFANLDRVFDPFYTTKEPGKGTGLGLSICYGIMREHGGTIRAFNTETGGCIALEMPIEATQAAVVAT